MNDSTGFDNSLAALGNTYSQSVMPTPVSKPAWLAWNASLAESMDLPASWQQDDATLASLAGNAVPAGATPVAAVYAGHQFGSYNPQLGDGRALLLGEWVNATGKRFDIQLKGSGPTPYSRGGDGRSPIGPVVREYLVSEAIAALGVPTTRALAAVATGDPVYRNVPEPGAVLTRVASSHLRVGSIQFFAMTKGGEGVAELVRYAAGRHYADALAELGAEPSIQAVAAVLLRESGKRMASLVAYWQSLGFIHGVLNTDNMLLSGETVDYGPCAFMDDFSNNKVFSSIDTQGRYAFRNQPGIVHWNFSVLAQCLLPLLDDDEEKALAIAQAEVDAFPQRYTDAYAARMAGKFGLSSFQPSDREWMDGFFEALEADSLDFTLAFRWLTETAAGTLGSTPLPALFEPSDGLLAWHATWQTRIESTSGDSRDFREQAARLMAASNPVVIPRNHQVAKAIEDAESGEYGHFHACAERWRAPFEWQTNDSVFAAGPAPQEVVQRTFCGT